MPPNSGAIAEAAKASNILFDMMISVPMGVGSNPPQGAKYFFIFLNILKLFRLVFYF